MSNKGQRKGAALEELLRLYFLEAGYYVVRGVPVRHRGIDVTDLDLWLYIRPSPLSRVCACVDAKAKSRPRALERILWARGVAEAFRLDQAVVATTDRRPETSEFGRIHDVKVLDGNFLQLLRERGHGTADRRLTEEQLLARLRRDKKDKLYDGWFARLQDAKARLVHHLDFDGCNLWLMDARFFAERYITESRDELAARLTFLLLSYFLVAVDYIMVDIAFLSEVERKHALADGFRYGAAGRTRSDQLLRTAADLIQAYLPDAKGLAATVRGDAARELEALPADGLAEYLSRREQIRTLLANSKEFEEAAFSHEFTGPAAIPLKLQSLVSVFLDHVGIERTDFFDNDEPAERAQRAGDVDAEAKEAQKELPMSDLSTGNKS